MEGIEKSTNDGFSTCRMFLTSSQALIFDILHELHSRVADVSLHTQ